MIELAIATGIDPAAWLDAGGRAIETALELIEEQRRRDGGEDERQLSG